MSLELINTLGTLLTTAIVAATATAALIQLRHMRTSNQIKAMLSIGDRFEDDTFQRAQDIVTDRLQPLLEDPAFRQYHTSHGGGLSSHEVEPQFVEVRLAAIRIGNSFEELGILVKKGIVDKTLFVDRYCLIVTRNWNCLERFTALQPRCDGIECSVGSLST